MSNIVIGISSGIAAFKSLDLIKLLKKDGHSLYVMMTKKAMHIVSPGKIEEITGYPVFIDLFEDNFSYEKILKEKKIDHIEIAKKADIFVIAPATANTIARCACGIADDFITTSILATISPVLICPSMNDKMWHHPAIQHNLKTLESYGYEIMTPASGSLACGTDGIGRLPDVKVIKKYIESILSRKKLFEGKKVVVTGGGTIEPIDDVRVITNRSSGKMGKALAEMAYRYGAEVTYLHSKTSQISCLPIKHIPFSTSDELSDLLTQSLMTADIVFHTAAVSDFTVKKHNGKISSEKDHDLHLESTHKIINTIKKINPKILLIGFKAVSMRHSEGETTERSRLINESHKLFKDAHADYVIVNDISRKDIGFESSDNEVYIVSKDKKVKKIEKASKMKIAEKIIRYIFK